MKLTRRSTDLPPEPPTVGLLGLFGVGNLGNDGSFEVGLAMVRELRPDADVVCICPAPGEISRRYGIPAIKMREPRRVTWFLDNERSGSLGRVLRPFAEVQRWIGTYRATRRLASIIIPGTGVLDDFGLRPQGIPYILLRWALCARISRTPLAFVGIGAGPIKHPKSRRLMVWAARLATHRSYRDAGSLTYMSELGAPGVFTPDIVFADARLSTTELLANAPVAPRKIIGVGVMSFAGWTDRTADGIDASRDYVARVVDLVGRLLDDGSEVALLTGAASDRATVRAVVSAVESTGRPLGGRIHTPEITSLADLCVELSKTDGAVVTRYHNLVCALIAGRACVPIGYEARFDELMMSVGLSEFGHRTESFDVEQVLADLGTAQSELKERHVAVRARLGEFEHCVRRDFAAVFNDF
jgi:polysaccharide pyruvyl transferase WcaK-like protein